MYKYWALSLLRWKINDDNQFLVTVYDTVYIQSILIDVIYILLSTLLTIITMANFLHFEHLSNKGFKKTRSSYLDVMYSRENTVYE